MTLHEFEYLKDSKRNDKINKIKDALKDLPKYQDEMQLSLAESGDKVGIIEYPINVDLSDMPIEWVISIANEKLRYLRIMKPKETLLGKSTTFDNRKNVIIFVYTNISFKTNVDMLQFRVLKNIFIFLLSTSFMISIFIPPLYDILDCYSVALSMFLLLLSFYTSISSFIQIWNNFRKIVNEKYFCS